MVAHWATPPPAPPLAPALATLHTGVQAVVVPVLSLGQQSAHMSHHEHFVSSSNAEWMQYQYLIIFLSWVLSLLRPLLISSSTISLKTHIRNILFTQYYWIDLKTWIFNSVISVKKYKDRQDIYPMLVRTRRGGWWGWPRTVRAGGRISLSPPPPPHSHRHGCSGALSQPSTQGS